MRLLVRRAHRLAGRRRHDQQLEPLRRRRHRARRRRRPLHLVQPIASGAERSSQLLSRRRARVQPFDPPERRARRVRDPQLVPADPHANPRRARRPQGHARPRERQPDRLVGGLDEQRVQRRVEQRRMQPILAGVRLQRLGQLGLGEQLVLAPPHRAQTAELLAVRHAARKQSLVKPVDRQLRRARRRPHAQLEALRCRRCREHTGRVSCPLAVGRTTKQAHLFTRHRQLHVDRSARRQRERRLQRQLLEPVEPDALSRRQRQLHQRRPRHQHLVEHLVPAHPAMAGARQPSRQHAAFALGQRHRRLQERMPRRRRRVPLRRIEPVALPLERIGRQLHRLALRRDLPPVDRTAPGLQLGRGQREPSPVTLIAPQRRQHRRRHAPAASLMPCSARLSTGCGLTSTKKRWPSCSSFCTASAKRTVCRRLRYQ